VSDHRGGPLTNAVISALSGFTVGDGEAPAAGGWQGSPEVSPFTPYVVVHSMPGGTTDGTMAAPNIDAAVDYQTTCVGATRAQAEEIADDVRDVMLDAALTLAGGLRVVIHRRLDFLGGALRDDTVQPALYIVPDRYRVFTTPA
jgi:hypothetical protein